MFVCLSACEQLILIDNGKCEKRFEDGQNRLSGYYLYYAVHSDRIESIQKKSYCLRCVGQSVEIENFFFNLNCEQM